MRRLRTTRLGFTLIELMMVVAILAILAVVAVPAFVKYMRRAKGTESIDELDKMYKGAAIYYTTPKINKLGSKLPCQVPASQGITPVQATCCVDYGGPDSDNDERCDNTAQYWDTATWSALSFQMTDQHYFVYSFVQNGLTMSAVVFTAQANGDLDCDSVQSTVIRIGTGDPNAIRSECSLQSSAAYYIEMDWE